MSMEAFGEVVLFLSALPKFADANLVLKDGVMVPISRVVFASFSRRILGVSFNSENRDYICLNDVDKKYFEVLKQFIYTRNDMDRSEETIALMILTSYIFGVPQIWKYVTSIFKEIDPVKLFFSIKTISTKDRLSRIVIDKSLYFFVKNINVNTVTVKSVLTFGKEAIELLSSRYLTEEKGEIKKLFDRYDLEIKDMLKKLSIFESKEKIQENLDLKVNILKGYSTKECVAICGYKRWFDYIVNWFLYSRDRNVDDFVEFLDCIVDYEGICIGLIERILFLFDRNFKNMFDSEKFEYLANSLNLIKNSVMSKICSCKYCEGYNNNFTASNYRETEKFIDDNAEYFRKNYQKLKVTPNLRNFQRNIFDINYREVDDSVSVFESASAIYNQSQCPSTTMYDGSESSGTSKNLTIVNTYVDDTSNLSGKRNIWIKEPSSSSKSILIAGARNFGNSLFFYDIENRKCRVLEDKFIDREGCKIEYMDGNIFIFGGKSQSGKSDSDIVAFNIESRKSINMRGAFSCGRTRHATIRQDNFVYIIGGLLDDKKETLVKYDLEYERKSVYIFDEPFGIIDHSLCEFQNSVYMFGGLTFNKTRNMFALDFRSKDCLRKLKPPPLPIFKTSVLQNGNILTSFGGATFQKGGTEFVALDQILQYDPTADNWISCNLNCGRSFYSGGACCVDEMFYTFGGFDSNGVPQKGVYLFKDGSWEHIGNLPTPLGGFDYKYF
uniref:BTB domain-containing protein n=1 Tax=Strongyloides stercoralis TaxID=6248 RepID=A0A0K0E528_STRER